MSPAKKNKAAFRVGIAARSRRCRAGFATSKKLAKIRELAYDLFSEEPHYEMGCLQKFVARKDRDRRLPCRTRENKFYQPWAEPRHPELKLKNKIWRTIQPNNKPPTKKL
jgi:hypothetical protein